MRLLLVALAFAAIMVAPDRAMTATCGSATARTAIAATKVRLTMRGDSATRIDPKSADQVICFDFTHDGRVDLAVSIASGGTAGDVGYVVFSGTPRGWRIALKGGGYKLGLARAGGDLVVTQPIYKKNDPNCCPTGGFDHHRYHWNGARFVVVRAWHTKSFRV